MVANQRLSTGRRQPAATDTPPVEEIIDVDRQYRREAERGVFRHPPRRFNPEHQPWLPLLHTKRATSTTPAVFEHALAHRLRADPRLGGHLLERVGAEHQATVVTERRGPSATPVIPRPRSGNAFVTTASDLELPRPPARPGF